MTRVPRLRTSVRRLRGEEPGRRVFLSPDSSRFLLVKLPAEESGKDACWQNFFFHYLKRLLSVPMETPR